MATPGLIPKILGKVEEARRPERFTQDFLETKLGHSGGGARPIIPLLKRMGFLAGDGTPTKLYDQFRNVSTRGTALASGVRNAYPELFDRNQYANDLSREKLTALVTEMTGLEKDSSVARLVVSTFMTLKEGADFEGQPELPREEEPRMPERAQLGPEPNGYTASRMPEDVSFRIGYTINLNLPETTDPEVFNAIFRSLKEHLLKS
jgi:hypothetical protein